MNDMTALPPDRAALEWATEDLDFKVAKIARVSAPENEQNTLTAEQLVQYLMKNAHWSPLEMVCICIEVHTTRDIGRQMLRHNLRPQEFCVAGNTLVTVEQPGPASKGARVSHKVKIEDLWDTWENGAAPALNRWGQTYRKSMKSTVQKQLVRVFDEDTREFTAARILNVFQTGVKPTFRVTLENGRIIECTKEHKFLTEEGFKPLEEAIGLSVIGTKAVMSKPDTALACNGVSAWEDKAWLSQAKVAAIQSGLGLTGMAEQAGCTTHTIRKWLKRHALQFTKTEVSSYTPAWNAGKSGYNLPKHRPETREKMRQSARHGSASNLWRGGVSRDVRQAARDWCHAHRADFLQSAGYKCSNCQNTKRLHLHHIQPLYVRPDLGCEPTNIQVVCKGCHDEIHMLRGDPKVWRAKGRGRTLTVHWSKVKHVEYVGEQMTYDLEVDHVSHNYVGNGIVVHNSQRYADVSKLGGPVIRQGRLRDPKNRQNSIPNLASDLQTEWGQRQQAQWDSAVAHYNWATENGMAKECARVVLPEGNTPTRMYFQAPLRDWLFYCNLRRGHGTQKEHMDVAEACWQVLCAAAPMSTAAFSSVMEAQQNATTELGRLRRIMEATIMEVSRWSTAASEELEKLFRGR